MTTTQSVNFKAAVIALIIIFAVLATKMAFSNADELTVIPMQEKGAQTYYVEAHIDGLGNSEFMVDTGSGYTTINEDTLVNLKAAGKAKYVKELVGVLADGSEKTVPVYKLDALALNGSCQVENVEAAVFPGTTRHILGLNTLRKMGSFEFSFAPPQLIFRDCGNS